MDSCFTCKKYPDCTTRLGCNLVGCLGWEPVANLVEICNSCDSKNCHEDIRKECIIPSKYMGYYRTLKYKKPK